METKNNFMTAAQNLMAARQRMKAVKAQEEEAAAQFTESILLDAIEQPSRVLRLDKYWRMSGVMAAQVERMVVRLIDSTDNPAFSGLRTERTCIRLKFAEMDERGNFTGETIEKVQEVPVIINLGEVKPPRDGSKAEEPYLGSAPLVSDLYGCENPTCYYIKKGFQCPYSSTPETKWKCANNWATVYRLIKKVLHEEV